MIKELVVESCETSTKRFIFTFDKFECIAFIPNEGAEYISKFQEILVYIPDRSILLYKDAVKIALKKRDTTTSVGFVFKKNGGIVPIHLEFFNEGAVKIECLTTTEKELIKTIKLINYKLCQS